MTSIEIICDVELFAIGRSDLSWKSNIFHPFSTLEFHSIRLLYSKLIQLSDFLRNTRIA
jgi:hypothetical protein